MYLDHNATSPMPDAVRDAVLDAMSHAWANPSSPHALGQETAARVQRCRQTIADALDVKPKTVFFTSGATEGNAWVLSQADAPVVSSATEHPSVLDWSNETIPVHPSGVINLSALEEGSRQAWLRPQTTRQVSSSPPMSPTASVNSTAHASL